jgi:hypothetical protein
MDLTCGSDEGNKCILNLGKPFVSYPLRTFKKKMNNIKMRLGETGSENIN